MRSRIESRAAVYGDCGAESVPVPKTGLSSGLEGIEGPSAGPWGGAFCEGRAAIGAGGSDAMGSESVSASDYQLQLSCMVFVPYCSNWRWMVELHFQSVVNTW